MREDRTELCLLCRPCLQRNFDQIRPQDLRWLSSHLQEFEDSLRFGKKLLTLAKEAGYYDLKKMEEFVAIDLLSLGLVNEAIKIHSSTRGTIAYLAFSQGKYLQAAKQLGDRFHGSLGHEKTVTGQIFGEALYRGGKFKKAADVLKESLKHAMENGYTCCQASILWKLIELELRLEKLDSARKWFNDYNQLQTSLGEEPKKPAWLLLAEGDIAGALRAAEEVGEDYPARSIERHTMRARIFLTNGQLILGRAELKAAEEQESASGYKQFSNDIKALTQLLGTLESKLP